MKTNRESEQKESEQKKTNKHTPYTGTQTLNTERDGKLDKLNPDPIEVAVDGIHCLEHCKDTRLHCFSFHPPACRDYAGLRYPDTECHPQ